MDKLIPMSLSLEELKTTISTELRKMADKYNQVAILDEFRTGGYLCSVKRIENFLFPILDKIMAEIRESAWHTGTPTDEGDYLVAFRMSDNSVEYGWCNWNNGAWDILCDYDPTDGSCGMIAWQKIEKCNWFDFLFSEGHRDNWREVRKIPTPHDELISRGEAIRMITAGCINCTWCGSACKVCPTNHAVKQINKVPTIVRANK